jgi:hypothetical protein
MIASTSHLLPETGHLLDRPGHVLEGAGPLLEINGHLSSGTGHPAPGTARSAAAVPAPVAELCGAPKGRPATWNKRARLESVHVADLLPHVLARLGIAFDPDEAAPS